MAWLTLATIAGLVASTAAMGLLDASTPALIAGGAVLIGGLVALPRVRAATPA